MDDLLGSPVPCSINKGSGSLCWGGRGGPVNRIPIKNVHKCKCNLGVTV